MRHRHQRHCMLAVNWHCCSVGPKRYATRLVERVAYESTNSFEKIAFVV